MSCNKCARQTESALEAAGVPSAQTQATWAGDGRQPGRCDHCRAFLPRSRDCQNPRCPTNHEATAAAPDVATCAAAETDELLAQRVREARDLPTAKSLIMQIADQNVIDSLVVDRGLFVQVRERLLIRASQSAVRQIAATSDDDFVLRVWAVYRVNDHETLDALFESEPRLRNAIGTRRYALTGGSPRTGSPDRI